MDNPIPQRLIMTGVCLALMLVLGWHTDGHAPLPDDGALAAGKGVTRGEPPAFVLSHLHSLRGVTHRTDASLNMPDLDDAIWKQKGNDFADVGDFNPAMYEDDGAYTPPKKTTDKKNNQNPKGLDGNKTRATDRFLKESEGTFKDGWLSGVMTGPEDVNDPDTGRDGVSSIYDEDTDPSGGWLDRGAGDDERKTSDSTYNDGYDNYLYDQMGDSGNDIGFDSLDGFENYAPKEE